MLRKGKIAIYVLWIVLIIGIGIVCLIYPELSSPEYITATIKKFQNEMLWIYILLTFVRGFFLIPSTPFVIAGALLFPEHLTWVLLISMAGIMFSTTSIYYFSDFLGFSKQLNKKSSAKIALWKSRLNSRKSIIFIAGWSLFPFVPTDIISYTGGILKTSFKHIFIGVFIGELILCSLYVYFGATILSFL
jgi:uncharacterized membrane protein YdjX (TVP38/TMEM64 family)